MVAASTPFRSMTLTTRLSSTAPRIVERVLGRMLELLIHAVEDRRERLTRLVR